MAARPPHGPGVATRPSANFGSKKFVFSFPYRDYPPRSSSPSSSDAVELPPSSRSNVAAWGSGWEEDFWFLFLFFLKTKRVKEGK
jgi:hypothetical protein